MICFPLWSDKVIIDLHCWVSRMWCYFSIVSRPLTLSPPAVKTQWLSQCQAFQRLVRSSHTLVNWTFDLPNQFSISLACSWKHCMLFASVCNINTLGQ
jgi:hypothetical protein